VNYDNIKLGIGIPLVGRFLDRDFVFPFFVMDKPYRTNLYLPSRETYEFRENIAVVRNSLVAQALADDCTHLLMMDTDQNHPPETAMKLLSHDLDAVGALVCRRYEPFYPVCYRGEIGHWKYVSREEIGSGELIEVDATGTGCILFNMRVFKDISAPWFELLPGPNGRTVGEDIRFCFKLKSAGYKIYVDTSVHVGHLTMATVDLGMHDLFMACKQHEANNMAK